MDLRTAASQIKSIWIKEKSGFPLFLRFGPAGRSCVLNFPQQREREILCDGRGPFAVSSKFPAPLWSAVSVTVRIARNGTPFAWQTCATAADSISTVSGAKRALITCRPSSVMKASPVTMRPKRTGYSWGCFAAAASAHARSAGSAGNQIDSSHG